MVRCPVLAAFTTNFDSENAAARVARMDTRLSHPNLSICEASAAYTVLARSLIITHGDRTAALAELRTWVEREIAQREGANGSSLAKGGPKGWVHLEGREKPKGPQDSSKEEEHVAPGAALVAFKELMSWIADSLNDTELPFSEELFPSSARVAFTHGLRHVKRGSSFEEAMRFTLAGGGDCSANATVVGGLIGAAVGLEGIPPRWLRAVLMSETFQGQPRPQEYHPSRLPKLVESFAAPSVV